ncbi:MAG: DUF3040 domain-containing protein [Actinomycetaceae bacterium]|nr:DUF3040 domain-containing protein [Actinomycetaceae bacterium]
MALSDYERQMLEELEAQLADEDPSFARTMKPASISPVSGRQVSLRNIVIGTIIAVVGIALLVVSIALPFIPLGVFGVLVMGLGFWYASSSKDSEAPRPLQDVSGQASQSEGSSFMERQAERWERRQDQ